MNDHDDDVPQERPYLQTSAYRWTERAFDLLDSGKLHGKVLLNGQVVSTRVWGLCPRCEHPLDDQQTPTAVTNLFGDGNRIPFGRRTRHDEPPAEITVDISCGCEVTHQGTPEAARGCGVGFRVILLLNADSRP